MADGMESRQGGRSSFAFAPTAASQSRPVEAGGFRGISVQGGRTVADGGGMVTPQTAPGNVGGFLGQFFEQALQPYVERKKKEMFAKGIVDQMSAVAGEEIRVNDKNPINKIFGPSAYEEGAIFYSSKKAVADWQTKMMADVDRLKRLPPDELSKVVAQSFEEMSTGDSFTDLAVSTALIEASPAVVGAIGKERYKWQQQTALEEWSGFVAQQSEASQAALVSLAQNSTGDGDEAIAANAAMNQLSAAFMKPPGMDEETYKKGVMGAFRRAAQAGNGYVTSMLKRNGLFNVLTDEEQTKLEDAELRYGQKALGRAAMGYATEIDAINEAMARGNMKPADTMAALQGLNQRIKDQTGFDLDLYDYKEVTGTSKSVWDAIAAQERRIEDRQWAIEDMMTKRQWEVEDREAEAATKSAGIMAAYSSGNIPQAILAGVGQAGDYALLMQQDYAAGNFQSLFNASKNFPVPDSLKNVAQADIKASIGTQYNPAFQTAVDRFNAMNKVRPSLAMQVYGDLYPKLTNFTRLRATMQPAEAFVASMSSEFSAQQGRNAANAGKGGNAAIDAVVENQQPWTFMGSKINPWARNPMNNSAQVALRRVLSGRFAAMGYTDLSDEVKAQQALEMAMNDGSFERYGQLGWSNDPGTPNLGKSLGLQQDEADTVVTGLVDVMLKRSGFQQGASGDQYNIRWYRNADGQRTLFVQAYDDEGVESRSTMIPESAFKVYADELRAGKVRKPVDRTSARGLDPYRRIKGETGAQRIARINREVAAGADPVNHFNR